MNSLLKAITPDWSTTGTLKDIEGEIPGFTMQGHGWYFRDGSSMLITPTDRSDVWTLMVFFDRDPREIFTTFGAAIVREGARTEVKRPNLWGALVMVIGVLVLIPLTIMVSHILGLVAYILSVIAVILWAQVANYFGDSKRNK